MTAQLHDQFIVEGESHNVAGVSGDGLFDPEAYGLQPVSWNTACWRGYVATYALRDRRLVVRELELNLSMPHQGASATVAAPLLNGVEARRSPEPYGFEYVYEDLGLLLPYNGGLLLARGFLDDLYVHMGFHPAWKYRKVLELIFEEGRLIETHDVSKRIARLRKTMMSSPVGSHREQAVLDWIESTFQLDYAW
jgi:hypothetical protein